MPVCPECHLSYPEGVVACRSCRVPLVDALGEGEAGDEAWVEMVSLRAVPNAVTGAMWRGALESQGIEAIVRSHALPAHGEVLHDWKTEAWGVLLVPSDVLEEAKLVLDDFIATAREQGPALDEDTET
jgi:hypothetical protein